MVAKQLRTVFQGDAPGSGRTGQAQLKPQIRSYSRCVVGSNQPEEGRFASENGDESPRLPFRAGGPDPQRHTEARAELRDRETYYAELRLAVHCQSRSHPAGSGLPAPRTPLDDRGPDTWTQATRGDHEASRTDEESWNELVARFGDTWT
jgi:hypothetical protein